jgi:hypothetical protein
MSMASTNQAELLHQSLSRKRRISSPHLESAGVATGIVGKMSTGTKGHHSQMLIYFHYTYFETDNPIELSDDEEPVLAIGRASKKRKTWLIKQTRLRSRG